MADSCSLVSSVTLAHQPHNTMLQLEKTITMWKKISQTYINTEHKTYNPKRRYYCGKHISEISA